MIERPGVDLRILRGAEIRELLPMADCIDLMRRTMIAVSEGRAEIPLRTVIKMPGDIGMMGNMGGFLADPECYGVKIVSLSPRNVGTAYSSHLGIVLLFETARREGFERATDNPRCRRDHRHPHRCRECARHRPTGASRCRKPGNPGHRRAGRKSP